MIAGGSSESQAHCFGNKEFKTPLLAYMNRLYPMGHEARFVLKTGDSN
jgi:hypothetical protein